MAILNIPEKSSGQTFTATELNEIVTAIKKLQSEKGHAVYFDTEFTEASPQVITSDDYVVLSNNKGNSVESFLPYGTTTLYDGGEIIPPVVGAGFSGYISFFAKVNSNNSYFDIGIDIGGTFNEIFQNANALIRGANVYQPYYLPINGYMLDTFNANNGVVKIRVKSGNTLSVYGTTFFLNVGYQQQ